MSCFFYGVIEGFYGRQWSWQAREDYASFLSAHGFDCYVYAPKGDPLLRSRWRENYCLDSQQRLYNLGQQYRRQGLRWGLGFSPIGLSQSYGHQDKVHLQEKIRQLNALQPDILCILFDDVRGDVEGLAERQLAVINDVLAVSDAVQHIVCPTYYSFDPVLEEVFGTMPSGYLQILGENLPDEVGVFWTGDKVIAAGFDEDELARVSHLLCRKPIIWDNYPVNDGRLTSEHLHLRAYTGRPDTLAQWSAGHMVNPMNQPLLSRLVLHTLQSVYQCGERYSATVALQDALDLLHDQPLAEQLLADVALFQDVGLSGMSAEQQQQRIKIYAAFNHPLAKEVVDWLSGAFRFDPQCLTG